MEKTIKKVILKQWLVNFIVDEIHSMHVVEYDEFNQWATNYKRESAEVIVDAEYAVDWGYDTRDEIPVEEAKEWCYGYITTRILPTWHTDGEVIDSETIAALVTSNKA